MNGDTTNAHDLKPIADMAFFDQKAAEIRAAAKPAAAPTDDITSLREEKKRLEDRLGTIAEEAEREAASREQKAREAGRAEILRSLGLAQVAADSLNLQKPDELLALIAAHNKGVDLGSSTTGPLRTLDPGLQKAADEQAARFKKLESDAAQIRSELQVERAAAAGNYGVHIQYVISLLADPAKPASHDGLPDAFHTLVDAIERAREPKPAVQSVPGKSVARDLKERIGHDSSVMKANDFELKNAREDLARSKSALDTKEKEHAELERVYQLIAKELPNLPLIAAGLTAPTPTAPELAPVAAKLEQLVQSRREQEEIIAELASGKIRPKLPGSCEPIAAYIRAAKEYEIKKKEYADAQELLTDARKGGLRVPQLQVKIIDLEAALDAKTKEYNAAKTALATAEKELALRTNRGKISVDYARAGIEHVRAKDYSSAITDFEKALTTNQGDPRIAVAALEGLACIAADFGDKGTAQAYAGLLVHLVGRVPGREANEHEMLAKIYEKLGDDRAQYHKQEAAKLPTTPQTAPHPQSGSQ